MPKCCNADCCPPMSDYLYFPPNEKKGWPEWEVKIRAGGNGWYHGEIGNSCCPCIYGGDDVACGGKTPHAVPDQEIKMKRPGSGKEYTFTRKMCECECDETKVMAYVNYDWSGPCNTINYYGVDEEGNAIYKWRCADATPDFDADTCSCKCNIESCPPETPTFVATKCLCKCEISNTACLLGISEDELCKQRDAAKPNFKGDDCSCYCALTDDDCGANEKVNEDKCECECVLTCPDGDDSKPDLDSTACECICDESSKTPCPSGTIWEAATCSCVDCTGSCNGCETYDAFCNCVGCADCDEVEYKYYDNNDDEVSVCCHKDLGFCVKDGVGSCYDTTCPTGQFFSYSKCACSCDNNKVLCTKDSGATVCRTPCPDGGAFDGNCGCCDHDGVCNDPSIPTFDPTSCQCVCEEPSCADGETFDENTCSCVSDEYYNQSIMNNDVFVP